MTAIFVRARPFALPAVPGAIVCSLIYPLSAATIMVGVPVVISGTISNAGTVSVYGIGAAAISGRNWSYVYTPVTGDIGSKTFTVTATDASNGTTSSASVTCAVVAAAVIPGGITPLAWFRRDAPAFSDLAGTVPATAPGAAVRRVNNVAPLTGYWQSPAGAARKDPAGVRLEPVTTASNTYPLSFVAGPGTSINLNDSTLVLTWVQRYGTSSLLMATGANPNWGVTYGLQAFINNAQTDLGLTQTTGARHSLVVRWTATACKAKLLINGVLAGSITISATITAGNPGGSELRVGHFQSFAYDSRGELLIVNRAVSDSEADSLLNYVDSIPAPPAYPLDRPLFAFAGDSNTVGVGVDQYDTFKFVALRSFRATYDPEMVCTAIVGAGVGVHAPYIAPYYDARRRKNIVVYLCGTNEWANGNPASTTLAAYLADCDAMRAQGWLVAAGTVQDRNGLFGGSGNLAYYTAQRAIFNAGIRAAAGARFDALIDIAAISGLGNVGDADGANFGPDKVHFSQAGYALLCPAVTAAIAPPLAA